MLDRTRFGRHVYAVGGNAEAARRAGINVDNIKIACFAICSIMAAIGGIMLASRLRSVDTNSGGGSLLLYSIAAPVIGGTSPVRRARQRAQARSSARSSSRRSTTAWACSGSARARSSSSPAACCCWRSGRLDLAPRAPAVGTIVTPGFQGKAAIVTGASRGIGAAVARELHGAGAQVGLLSRSGDDLGLDGALGVECDVRDRGQVEAAVAAVVERFGRLDVAVANAGVGAYGSYLDLDPEQLDLMIDINLKGTLYTARAALPHLIEAGESDFVALASEAGRRGLPNEAVYGASKFGQVGFVRSLEHELREHGVRCTNVCPGGVATDFAIGTGRTRDMPSSRG